MNIEQIKEKQNRAYQKIDLLNNAIDYESACDIYRNVCDLLDDALIAAIKLIEEKDEPSN